jgi:hypothetical protein
LYAVIPNDGKYAPGIANANEAEKGSVLNDTGPAVVVVVVVVLVVVVVDVVVVVVVVG